MQEYFLTYEQSLAVKELGFDEPCIAVIDQIQSLHIKGSKRPPRGAMVYDEINCPLKSQFFKWVREKYEHNTEIVWMTAIDFGYSARVKSKLGTAYIGGYDTYEQAEDACIDKIIELLKLK